MSGYDLPQRYDMTWVAELRRPSSVDAIKMAINRIVAQGQISKESKQRIRESGDYLPSCRCAVGCRVDEPSHSLSCKVTSSLFTKSCLSDDAIA